MNDKLANNINDVATIDRFLEEDRYHAYMLHDDLKSKKYKKFWNCHLRFRNFILQEGYPCIGAQTAMNAKSYAMGIFDTMGATRTVEDLAIGLNKYTEEMSERPSDFFTYIAIFKEQPLQTEMEFEKSLWELLAKLNVKDSKIYDWCPEVDDDPSSPNFSFSFANKAFYIVGMHPHSSRTSRRIGMTAMAFNLHSQFENLRKKGRYQRIKKVIRNNELSFSGSINPMLNDFGEGLEAPQYSGRKVDQNWKCPF